MYCQTLVESLVKLPDLGSPQRDAAKDTRTRFSTEPWQVGVAYATDY
jgi:hypothetical protein